MGLVGQASAQCHLLCVLELFCTNRGAANPGWSRLSAGSFLTLRLAHAPKRPTERRPQRGPRARLSAPQFMQTVCDGQSKWHWVSACGGLQSACRRLDVVRGSKVNGIGAKGQRENNRSLRSRLGKEWLMPCDLLPGRDHKERPVQGRVRWLSWKRQLAARSIPNSRSCQRLGSR